VIEGLLNGPVGLFENLPVEELVVTDIRTVCPSPVTFSPAPDEFCVWIRSGWLGGFASPTVKFAGWLTGLNAIRVISELVDRLAAVRSLKTDAVAKIAKINKAETGSIRPLDLLLFTTPSKWGDAFFILLGDRNKQSAVADTISKRSIHCLYQKSALKINKKRHPLRHLSRSKLWC
jgi:hypothetical protein